MRDVQLNLISFYLLELFGFSLVTVQCSCMAQFYRVQTWLSFSWFELVLLAQEVLPFTWAGTGEKVVLQTLHAARKLSQMEAGLLSLTEFPQCVSISPICFSV